jgi:pimeloyl-ACP methyl ester carboxylesterase
VLRGAAERVERLVLMDTTAVADTPARRDGRLADSAKAQAGGIEALIPELPRRWLLPAHARRERLVALMADRARSIGARGQRNQQTAMLARPDSHAVLARVRVPTLILCGRGDPVTPVADHEAMAACVPSARLAIVEDCGHLSTIEQPDAVNRVLIDWLRDTDAAPDRLKAT